MNKLILPYLNLVSWSIMKKLLLPIIVSTATMMGCTTTKSLSTANNVSVAKMKLAPVTVTLKQKYDNPTFYSQADLQQRLTQCLTNELSKRGKYQSDANPTLSVNIDYQRIYTGEAFGMKNAVARPKMGYSYQIISADKMLQQKQEMDLVFNAGLLGNVKSAMTLDLNNTDKGAENEYLDALCRHIATQIK